MRVGYAAIAGVPNVGKSTLMNAIVGAPISITSPKPQTTRSNIVGIKTAKDFQIVFLDTPGFHLTSGKLNKAMVHAAESALYQVNVICILENAFNISKSSKANDFEELLQKSFAANIPVILAITKSDIHSKDDLYQTAQTLSVKYDFKHIIPISAKKRTNIDKLTELIAAELPEGSPLYDSEELTTQPLAFLASEYVREEIFLLLEQEIPYNILVETTDIKESEELVSINANIIVSRDSHKPIVIGSGASMLKEIGTRARKKLQNFLGVKVRLDLFVSVKENWMERGDYIKLLNS